MPDDAYRAGQDSIASQVSHMNMHLLHVEKAAKDVIEAYMAGEDMAGAIAALEIACGFKQQEGS